MVAIFIPVVISVAQRLHVLTGRLMMPLSFAGLIGGMLTLVATPPNMVVDSALKQDGFKGLGFFSFTPFGAVILILGIAYMLAARRWLSVKAAGKPAKSERRSFLDFIRDYKLARRERRLRVRPDSPLVGRTLRELQPRREHTASVIGNERKGKFRSEVLNPEAGTKSGLGTLCL